MNRQRAVTAVAIAAVLVTAGAVWVASGRVPDMVGPLKVEDAYALADGGTIGITLVDATGRRFAFGLRGSLKTPRERFPAYIQRWPSLPLAREPEFGGNEEGALAVLARRASRDNAEDSTMSAQLAAIAEVLERGWRRGS